MAQWRSTIPCLMMHHWPQLQAADFLTQFPFQAAFLTRIATLTAVLQTALSESDTNDVPTILVVAMTHMVVMTHKLVSANEKLPLAGFNVRHIRKSCLESLVFTLLESHEKNKERRYFSRTPVDFEKQDAFAFLPENPSRLDCSL